MFSVKVGWTPSPGQLTAFQTRRSPVGPSQFLHTYCPSQGRGTLPSFVCPCVCVCVCVRGMPPPIARGPVCPLRSLLTWCLAQVSPTHLIVLCLSDLFTLRGLFAVPSQNVWWSQVCLSPTPGCKLQSGIATPCSSVTPALRRGATQQVLDKHAPGES